MQAYEAVFWLMCTLGALLIILKLGNVCAIELFDSTNARERVLELRGVLTQEECKSLMDFASAKGMHDSEVLDKNSQAGAGVKYNDRKSKQVWIQYNDHPVAKKLSMLSTQLTGYPESNQEILQVVRYEEGGEFKAHYDACDDTDVAFCDRMNKGAGQRRATLLVYLNDDFNGGETMFVNQDKAVKPVTGSAVLFWDTYEDDRLIDATKHQGMPVMKGNKWIATVWSHPKPYPN